MHSFVMNYCQIYYNGFAIRDLTTSKDILIPGDSGYPNIVSINIDRKRDTKKKYFMNVNSLNTCCEYNVFTSGIVSRLGAYVIKTISGY